MTRPLLGSLFTGVGGLELGLAQVLDFEVAWHCENNPAAVRVLEARFPGVPNLGDVGLVDFDTVPRVNILTGGTPCQDVSHAGRRVGMRAGTRSGLWAQMCDAVDRLRPELVIWENVRGAFSAGADSEMEPCPGCLGTARGARHLLGLPPGWVTDVPGISRNDQLRLLGNGVVPNQSAAALHHLLTIDTEESA